MAFLYFETARIGETFNNLDQSDQYFECANYLRMALAQDENLPEANFLLGLLYEEGLSIDKNIELAF